MFFLFFSFNFFLFNYYYLYFYFCVCFEDTIAKCYTQLTRNLPDLLAQALRRPKNGFALTKATPGRRPRPGGAFHQAFCW